MFRIIIAAVAVLVFLAACGEAGGDTRTPAEPATAAQTPTTGPTATPTHPPGGAGGELEGTVVPLAPLPSLEPLPEEWATYVDPGGRFSLRYPPSWHTLTGGGIYSWDPATWDKPWFPPDSVKLDVSVASVGGLSACGPISLPDGTPAADSAVATLGGVSARRIVYAYDPSQSGGVTLAQEIAAVHDGYCFNVAAIFAQEHPDVITVEQMLGSFTFTDQPS